MDKTVPKSAAILLDFIGEILIRELQDLRRRVAELEAI